VTSHGVNVDAEVTNHCRWRNAEGTDDGAEGGQTMLTTDRCAPHELNRKPICDFLLVINTNFHPVLHRFQVIADYWSNLRF